MDQRIMLVIKKVEFLRIGIMSSIKQKIKIPIKYSYIIIGKAPPPPKISNMYFVLGIFIIK